MPGPACCQTQGLLDGACILADHEFDPCAANLALQGGVKSADSLGVF